MSEPAVGTGKKETAGKQMATKPAISKRENIVVIRIKTIPTVSEKTERTLHYLNLHKKFYCSIHPSSKSLLGMLNRVKSLITWGEIDQATLKSLEEKRKEEGKKFFRLHPPRKGFERKGIKLPFNIGGAYGNRGKEINKLIMRML